MTDPPMSGPGPGVGVVEVELTRVRVPLRNPLHSARVTQLDRESILVRVVGADGVEGHSECPTLSHGGYVTETTDAAWAALMGELVPALLSGRSPRLCATPAASAALADAQLDADLRRGDLSMSDWLGEQTGLSTRSHMQWCAVLPDVSLDPEQAAARAAAAVLEGATSVKLKMARMDVLAAAVARIRVETDVPLCADANGTLSAGQLAELDELELSYIEQPLPAGTPWEELAAVRDRLRTPIALDESLVSVDAVADALRVGALDIASLKPSRMGGCLATARAAELCVGRDADCFVGGMLELGIGRAAGLAVASLAGCTQPTDLGPSRRYFETDVCPGLVTDGSGDVLLPEGPGIGREPDRHVVAAYALDTIVLDSAGAI